MALDRSTAADVRHVVVAPAGFATAESLEWWIRQGLAFVSSLTEARTPAP